MKSLNILFVCLLFSVCSYGQGKFLTKQGYTSFFSSSPIEDITAVNNQVLSIIDTSTGKIAISILMKSFVFEKSLMQEHFNENYVESDVYPKAIFKGEILNLNEDEEIVHIKGNLTIHGITQQIEIQSTVTKAENSILLSGDFPVKIADYGIKIPAIVTDNIAEVIKVTFELNHKPYKK